VIVATATVPVVVTFTAAMAVTELDPLPTTTDTTVLQIVRVETMIVLVAATEIVVTVVPLVVTAVTHTVADVLLVIDPLLARELLNQPMMSAIAAQFSSSNLPLDYAPRNSRPSSPRSVLSRKLKLSRTASVAAARALATLNSRKKNRSRRHLV
jgi:hypothetical protein